MCSSDLVDGTGLYGLVVRLATAKGRAYLLLVSFLGHQRERHGIIRGLRCLWRGRLKRCLTSRPLHRQRYVKHTLAFEFPGFHALRHHLLEFTVKFGFRLWVAFLFLPSYEDLFVFGLTVTILFRVRAGRLITR